MGTEKFQSSCSFLLPRIPLSAPSAHCPCTLHGQAIGLSRPLYPFMCIWLNPIYLSGPTSKVPTWPPAPIFQPETVSPPWFPMAGPAGKTSLGLSQGWYLFPSNAPAFSRVFSSLLYSRLLNGRIWSESDSSLYFVQLSSPMLHTRNIPSWCLRNGCNLFVLRVFFPLGPYSYLCLQPERLSPKLLTYRSVCRGGPHAFPTTGQTKCILYLSNHPLHLLFSASFGARTTHMVIQA